MRKAEKVFVAGLALLFAFALLSISPRTVSASPGWWDSNWLYKKQFEIDCAKVMGENLENFPVLVNLSTDSDLAAYALDNGDDIVFVDNTETYVLQFEIENFSGDNGQLTAWVKIPILYDNENTEFYMYYGNASATSLENAENVWDDNYLFVWHMSNAPGEYRTGRWRYTNGGVGGFDGENYWASVDNDFNDSGQWTYWPAYGYGTYTWKGIHDYENSIQGFTMQGLNDNKDNEADPNFVAFEHWYVTGTGKSQCRAATRYAGNYSTIVIWEEDPPGENWKTEHTYRIDWSANEVTFWIDGDNKGVITTNIPPESENMCFYACAGWGSTETAMGTDNIASIIRDVSFTPLNSSHSVTDSTGNADHGAKAIPCWQKENEGKIYESQQLSPTFGGNGKPYIKSQNLSWSANAPFTAELWFYSDNANKNYNTLISSAWGTAGAADSPWLLMAGNPANENKLGATMKFSGTWGYAWGASTYTPNTWHYAVLAFDGTNARIYLDNALYLNCGASGTIAGSNKPIQVGLWTINYKGYLFYGKIDEVRYSNVYRSSGWLATTFQNENNPSAFYLVGAAVGGNAPPNKPVSLAPTTRQTTTNVAISCVATDNDGDRINVFFYNDATKNLIDNKWIDNGGTAQVTWSGLTRGQIYTFFARGQDNNGAWGDNSNTQSFLVNSVPVCSITTPNGYTAGVNEGIGFTSSCSDADGDSITYLWNFGDGSGASTQSNPAYSYSSSGDYTVTLVVRDGYESSALASIVVCITAPPSNGGDGGPPGPPIDSDSDGIPDWWETEHGLNPNVNDANQDTDGDGYTNLQEYQAGTDPTNPESIPAPSVSGGGLPPGFLPIEEAQRTPVDNILFVCVFAVGGVAVQLWVLIVLIAVYGWWSDQKGIAYASLMMLGFLAVFGGNLLAMVGG